MSDWRGSVGEALRGERGSQVQEMVHNLLGCALGNLISVWNGEHYEPCNEPAERIFVLHDGDQRFAIKVCAKHMPDIEEGCTPHAG